MGPLPIAEWQAALVGIEAGLAAAVAALDDYERRCGPAYADPPAAAGGEKLLARLDDGSREWDARLTAAGELAASVEKLAGEREAAFGRWRELVARWHGRLQQPAAAVAGQGA